jgi:hypothetical protein
MNFVRRLQEDRPVNIFLIFRGDEIEEEETTSPAPSDAPSEKPEKRSIGNFRSCGTAEDGPPTSTETILFVYDVETNVEEVPIEVEQMILESLTTSLVDSIYAAHCGRRLGQSSRKLRIESIAPGADDKFLESCESQNLASKSCKRYDGSLVVGFNDEGKESTDRAVGNAVLQRIAADMANDEYLPSLNLAIGFSEVGVTKVKYEGTSFFDQFDQQDQTNFAALNDYSYTVEESGLSTFGKAMVPILVLMFLCMLGAICLMQRSRVREEKRELATLVSEDGELCLDRSELCLDRSDAESYVSADMNDLGLFHSKLDVIRCNKTNCSACSVLPSIQEVDIPPTDDERDYGPSVEAHLGSGSNIESLDSIFCIKPEMPIKRGMFGFGRSRTPPMIEVSGPIIEVSGEVQSSKMESFDDEPQRMSFVKIDDVEMEPETVILGTKRSVVDDSGYVRNEIEL